MTEILRFSKACIEDLAIGDSTRQVRLADGGVYTLTEISVPRLLTLNRSTLRATDFNGSGVMTYSSGIPANRRIWGVTIKINTTFGTTGGLTGLFVGDSIDPTRWSNAAIPLTSGTETDEGDFSDMSLMIYPTAANLLVTAVGGLFDATGSLEVCIHSSLLRHPS